MREGTALIEKKADGFTFTFEGEWTHGEVRKAGQLLDRALARYHMEVRKAERHKGEAAAAAAAIENDVVRELVEAGVSTEAATVKENGNG